MTSYLANLTGNLRLPAIKNRRWFATVWLVVTLLFLGLILAAVHIRNSDEVRAIKLTEKFMIAIVSDDTDRAYDMGGPTFHAAVTEENLVQVFDQVGPYVRRARIDEVDRSVPASIQDGSRIAIVYKASKSRSASYVRVVIERRSGDWQIYSLQFANQRLSASQP